jgi:homoserine acetyltransferase
MITYRSGPEWDIRFKRKFKETSPDGGHTPVLCPDFLIETYLDHQVNFLRFPYHAPILM